FIVRTNVLGRVAHHRGIPNLNDVRLPNANSTFVIRRITGRLAARWHVSPQTNRLECHWSLEALASDDQLCRSIYRTTRRSSPRSLHRNSNARTPCHE